LNKWREKGERLKQTLKAAEVKEKEMKKHKNKPSQVFTGPTAGCVCVCVTHHRLHHLPSAFLNVHHRRRNEALTRRTTRDTGERERERDKETLTASFPVARTQT